MNVPARLLIVCAAIVLAPAEIILGQGHASPEFNLSANAELISQDYCGFPDKEIGDVGFRLHVTIRNHGDRPVILCKKYVEIGCPIVNHARPDGTVGDVAFALNCDSVQALHYPSDLRREYAIVRPGSEFQFTGGSSAWFRLASSHENPRGYLNSGTYWLQVTVSTWEASPDSAALLRDRWSRHGDLFEGVLTANPVLVRIDIPQNPPECK